MTKKITTVIFDVGGVLALGKYSLRKFKHKPLGKSFHEFMARKLKIDMDSWFDSIANIHNQANEGTYSKEEAIKLMAKNLKVNPARLENYFYKAYKNSFSVNAKLLHHAIDLKRAGYKIAILSDQWQLASEVFIPERYYALFDEVVVSCDVRMKKPDPRIYKYTLKKLKAKPGECVFIDNRDYNLIPARNLGMKTVLFDTTKQVLHDLKQLGVTA